MAELLKGKEVVAAMKERLLQQVNKLEEAGVHPQMAIVRCGARPDDLSYEAGAIKRFSGLGIGLRVVELPQDIDQPSFIGNWRSSTQTTASTGCWCSVPCPPSWMRESLNMSSPRKRIWTP